MLKDMTYEQKLTKIKSHNFDSLKMEVHTAQKKAKRFEEFDSSYVKKSLQKTPFSLQKICLKSN